MGGCLNELVMAAKSTMVRDQMLVYIDIETARDQMKFATDLSLLSQAYIYKEG